MLTVPHVLTRSHASLACIAADMAPRLTLISLTGVFAPVPEATRELIAALHLGVTQLLTAAVMAPRLTQTAAMAVTALVMKGSKEKTAQLPQSQVGYFQ